MAIERIVSEMNVLFAWLVEGYTFSTFKIAKNYFKFQFCLIYLNNYVDTYFYMNYN